MVVLGGDPSIAGDGLGLLCAVGSLLTFIGYYLCTRRGRTSNAIDPLTFLAGATLSAAICVTPVALAVSSRDDYAQLGGSDWFYLGFAAVVVGMLGHGAMSWAHKYVPATRSSLYLLGMNVVSIVAAWPLLHEPIRMNQAAGCIIVLGAVAAVIARSGSVVGVETSTAGDLAPP
jgi:drug/metabolite transporter (DMT)-like permease